MANLEQIHPNAIIFAPFMTNVVVKLINSSTEMKMQISAKQYAGSWGGGLHKLREYCRKWDQVVHNTCKATPVQHPIWRTFIRKYEMPHANKDELSDIKVLIHLLAEWQSAGNNKPGAYPSSSQQCTYLNLHEVVPYTLILRTHIVQNKFTQAYLEHGFELNMNHKQDTNINISNKDYLIIAPFLKHVLMTLISKSDVKMKHNFIANDIDGLKEFRSNYDEWDTMIHRACDATPIQHPIWRTFGEHNERVDDVKTAIYLMHTWLDADASKQQMNAYMHMDGMEPIWKWLHDKEDAVKIWNRKKKSKKEIRYDYGLILSPLLTNIVQLLLGIPSNHHYFSDEWMQALKVIKECYPEWDEIVTKCVNITPKSHPIWKRILNESNVRNKDKIKPEQMFKCLLSYWKHLKMKHESYSMCVPTKSGDEYLKVKGMKDVFGSVLNAFHNGAFDYYFILCTNRVTNVIFGIFIKHIMSKLIQHPVNNKEKHVLSQCLSNWNKIIQICAEITPIDHDIWREFIKTYSISNKATLSNAEVIRYQLDYYSINEVQPSINEQKTYTKYVIKQWIQIVNAVLEDKFEAFIRYESEEKRKQKQQNITEETVPIWGNKNELNHEDTDADDDNKQEEDETEQVPALYSAKYRTLSSLLEIYDSESQQQFICKLCDTTCTESDGITYKDSERTFYCDDCIQSNLYKKKKHRSKASDASQMKPILSPERKHISTEDVPYHMKEHKLFEIQLTDDSPFNYNKTKSFQMQETDLNHDENQWNNTMDTSLRWNFDFIHNHNEVNYNNNIANHYVSEFSTASADGSKMRKTHYNMNFVVMFLAAIVALFVICLMEPYSGQMWIKFIFNLVNIIHFVSVSSVAMMLFIIWLYTVYQKISVYNKAKVVDIDVISYRKMDEMKLMNEERNIMDELLCYMHDAAVRWCNCNKKLWNPYTFTAVALFCWYLLIASDAMLPSKLNILNLVSFATLAHVVWLIYFGYLLCALSHDGDTERNKDWNMLPFVYAVFMLGSLAQSTLLEEYSFCKTLLFNSFEFALLTTILSLFK